MNIGALMALSNASNSHTRKKGESMTDLELKVFLKLSYVLLESTDDIKKLLKQLLPTPSGPTTEGDRYQYFLAMIINNENGTKNAKTILKELIESI